MHPSFIHSRKRYGYIFLLHTWGAATRTNLTSIPRQNTCIYSTLSFFQSFNCSAAFVVNLVFFSHHLLTRKLSISWGQTPSAARVFSSLEIISNSQTIGRTFFGGLQRAGNNAAWVRFLKWEVNGGFKWATQSEERPFLMTLFLYVTGTEDVLWSLLVSSISIAGPEMTFVLEHSEHGVRWCCYSMKKKDARGAWRRAG